MSNGRTNWAIVVATVTFPVAAIALVVALRPGEPPKAPKPPAPPRFGPPPPPGAGPGFHPPPPWPGMQGHRGDGLPPRWRARLGQRIQALAKGLGLTEAQRAKMRTVADQANDRLAEITLAERKLRRSLRRLLAKPTVAEAQIKQVLAQLAKVQAEAEQLRVLTPWRLRNLLTEKQRQRLTAGPWSSRSAGPGGPGWGGPMGPPPGRGPGGPRSSNPPPGP